MLVRESAALGTVVVGKVLIRASQSSRAGWCWIWRVSKWSQAAALLVLTWVVSEVSRIVGPPVRVLENYLVLYGVLRALLVDVGTTPSPHWIGTRTLLVA